SINEKTIEKFEQITSMEFIRIDSNITIVILSLERTYDEKKLTELFNKLANIIQKKFREKFNRSLSVLISLKYARIENIYKIYLQLKNYSDLSIFLGQEKILFIEFLKNPVSNRSINFDKYYNSLRLNIKDCDLTEISKTIHSMFLQTKEPFWNKKALVKLCDDLIYLIETYREENDQTSLKDDYNNGQLDIKLLYNIENLEIWFTKEFCYISEFVVDFDVYNYSIKTQRIIKFIKKNYKNSITIKDAVDKLKLNKNYIDYIIKKETGLSFLEYLTKFRIEKSKYLIKNTNYKLYEISDMVGFKPSQHFYGIFKDLIGLTPLEYKDLKNNNPSKGYPKNKL
ncbi:MAG: AraC family transcriptional regulator, partial [Clostridiales bacterium]